MAVLRPDLMMKCVVPVIMVSLPRCLLVGINCEPSLTACRRSPYRPVSLPSTVSSSRFLSQVRVRARFILPMISSRAVTEPCCLSIPSRVAHAPLRRIHPAWCRSLGRSRWSCRRLCHRHRRRRWCPGNRSAAPALRRHDFDPHCALRGAKLPLPMGYRTDRDHFIVCSSPRFWVCTA